MSSNLAKYAERFAPVEVGCDLWDNCFKCPLDIKYCGCEVNMEVERLKTVIILLNNQGLSSADIAKRLDKSVRTVDRYLEEIKKQLKT